VGNKKIILSADSTCDIGPELQKKFNVQFFDFHIQIGEESFVDMKEVSPDDLYAAWREKGILPKTAAITPGEYNEYFSQWVSTGYEVIHFNLGSALSVAHQNCCLAATDLGHIYPIDSCNLSTGIGLLVVKAGEMIAKGMAAEEIVEAITGMISKSHASFILDTLEFMRAGGRCSAVAAFGANLLGLKVGIGVDNTDHGKMGVAKKYRGSYEKVLVQYVADKLSNRDDLDLDRIFITHSGSPESDFELVRQEIKKYADFKELYITRASGTISAHCGPRTLGILFMTK
jgi:DegV family protein with EDD domain